MKAAVIVFPGSNRDRDTAVALAQAMGTPPVMVWHRDTELPEVDLIVLPGGFSYGDYLRCGAMAARSPIMREVVARAGRGVRVLGICNGFQILTESGLLPGALMRNATLKYISKPVRLRVEATNSEFTRGYAPGEIVTFPVSHGDGNYNADEATLDRLEGEGRVAFRYEGGSPNGSARHIAGIFDENRRVLGMMPHPECAVEPLHGSTDGARLFKSLVEALA
ncbi:MAG TPA: phosphoribosylformylglycinamidine synthase subunit PurQ [Azospirillaceae bacterium]|nr:phosphoribosylformylglycinamidine synthase subunit PurQ [Azospirillaceae bacterium]